ncbi:MAG: patatin-like phospholipase family protein [Dysgonamonadaceae bacterium]|nr:patatin-like phospholipase family protein [Dysgonamonadaceae bacterium]
MKKIRFFIGLLVLSSFPLSAQKVGLVLSGGGAKGAVHIGIIKALEDNEIPIDYIAGTSIGSIVGGLYAAGYSPDEILTLFLSDDFYYWQSGKVEEDYYYYFKEPPKSPEFTKFMVPLRDSVNLRSVIMPKSFINPIQMNQAFMGLFAQAGAVCNYDFNRLFVPFLCVASDVYNKKSIIFQQGDMGDAVRASMTFPFFFKPIQKDSIPLFDGGIYDNFPIRPMKEIFKPDFIIGSSVANVAKKKPSEQDLYEQIENMIMQQTDYSLGTDDGIILDFQLDNVNLLDFNRSRELFIIGYKRGMEMSDSLRKHIDRRADITELKARRKNFRQQLPPLVFKNIYISGINELQQAYVKNQIHPHDGGSFTMKAFKESYFKLLTDSKITEIIPHARYNPEDNTFDLLLDVTINDDIMIAFGGNISSLNANQLYLGLGYQSLTKYLLNFNLDMQVGNAYSGLVFYGRVEPSSKTPLYLQAILTYNDRKYYESNRLFIDTELSTFIHQTESYGKFGIGLPFMKKSRIEAMIGYGILKDKYFQSNMKAYYNTTFDRSRYALFSLEASIKKNTLNYKQYPIAGQEHLLVANFVSGNEKFSPANKIMLEETANYQSWVQIKGKINNYLRLNPKFNLGYLAEIMLSSKNLLGNYTASVLQAPAFTPTPHSILVLNESFRANQYLAGGVTPIMKLNQTIHLRGDFDVFVPFYPINRDPDGMAVYGKFFHQIAYMGELSFVVQLPFMSIGFYGNYYDFPKNNWNFGLNIGYLIFSPKFL